MSRAEQERSQERREASGTEAEQVQQFGAVFYITIGISAAFDLAGVYFTEPFGGALATVVGWITSGLGWLSMLMTSFFLGFAVWLALSRYGKIRLGQSDDRPEFGRFAWFAMLFPASPENTMVTVPAVELFILLIRIASAPPEMVRTSLERVISTSSGETPESETRITRSLPLATTSVEGTQTVA
jgi:choline-glycine betaine transporter